MSEAGDGTFPMSDLPDLPMSEWEEADCRDPDAEIWAQIDGFCTAYSTIEIVAATEKRQGTFSEYASATDVYYNSGGRWGSGITLESALYTATTEGIAHLSSVPNQWRWVRPPAGERAQHKIHEWDDLNGRIGRIAACLKLRQPAILGITWPDGGGHCVMADRIYKRGLTWRIGGPNTWGSAWGDNGYWDFATNQLRNLPAYGAWTARSVVVPSDMPTPVYETMTRQEAMRQAARFAAPVGLPRKLRRRKYRQGAIAIREVIVDLWPKIGDNVPDTREQLAANLYNTVSSQRAGFGIGGWLASWVASAIIKWFIQRVIANWWKRNQDKPTLIAPDTAKYPAV
jgi:hypothetical protein